MSDSLWPSRQINTVSLPAYMRGRTNLSGPNLGFPFVLSQGPVSISSTTQSLGVHLPMKCVPMVFGWTATAAADTCTMNLGGSSTSANPTTVTANWGSSSSIALSGALTGAMYFDDTTATYYLKRTSGSSTPNAITDPVIGECTGAGGTTTTGITNIPDFFVLKLTISGGSVTDFCWYIMLYPVAHVNDVLNSTDSRIIVAPHPEWD